MKILVNYDFLGNQIQNAVIHAAAEAPVALKAGQMYFNTEENTLYIVKTLESGALSWDKAGVVYDSESDEASSTQNFKTVITALSANGEVTRTAIADLVIGEGEDTCTLGDIHELVHELEDYKNRDGVTVKVTTETDDSIVLGTIEAPKNMDIAVIKRLIAGTTDKYEVTTYVYDAVAKAWKAADGSYNAENVYFDENITITTQVGNISLTNGSGTIPASGKNLKQVFESIWTKEDTTVARTNPSVTLAVAGSQSGEVGTTFTTFPSATLTFTSVGKYQDYGSKSSNGTVYAGSTASGVKFTEYKIAYGTSMTNNTNVLKSETGLSKSQGNTVSYSIAAADVPTWDKTQAYIAGSVVKNGDNYYIAKNAVAADKDLTKANGWYPNIIEDASVTYAYSASAKHGDDDRKPVTNLGNFIKDTSVAVGDTSISGSAVAAYADGTGEIKTNTVTSVNKTVTVSGYRNYWYGFSSTKNASDIVRNAETNVTKGGTLTLTAGGKAVAAGALPTLTAPEGAAALVVVVPTKSGKVISAASLPDSLNAPIKDDFTTPTTTLVIPGVDGYVTGDDNEKYTVYMYAPDAIPAGTRFDVTIG